MKWQVKAAVQTALAITPGGERINFMLQQASGSHSLAAQVRDFSVQWKRVMELNARFPIAGKTVVEIGTGWNGIGVLIFALAGAGKIHTYDHVRHLRFDAAQALLRAAIRAEPSLANAAIPMLTASNLDELLAAARTEYHAPGDAARTGLPDKSVDLAFSYGVLEHIAPDALDAMIKENARILRGRAYHAIGTHDHFRHFDHTISAANFLKYRPWTWALVNNKISYQNRWRTRHYLDLFAKYGGRIVFREDECDQVDIDAVKKMKIRAFDSTGFSPEELATAAMNVDVVFGER